MIRATTRRLRSTPAPPGRAGSAADPSRLGMAHCRPAPAPRGPGGRSPALRHHDPLPDAQRASPGCAAPRSTRARATSMTATVTARGWYRAHFPVRVRGGARLAFEASGDYLFHPLAAARIARELPGALRAGGHGARPGRARLLGVPDTRSRGASRRCPSARRWRPRSAGGAEAGSNRSLPGPRTASFSERHHSYVQRGQYAEQIERFVDALGACNRVHVIDAGRFVADPLAVFADLQQWLGLDAHRPPDRRVRVGNERPGPPLPSHLEQRLRSHFEEHDAALARLLDHPPSWRRESLMTTHPHSAFHGAPADRADQIAGRCVTRWHPRLRDVPVDKLLLGAQNGVAASLFAKAYGDPAVALAPGDGRTARRPPGPRRARTDDRRRHPRVAVRADGPGAGSSTRSAATSRRWTRRASSTRPGSSSRAPTTSTCRSGPGTTGTRCRAFRSSCPRSPTPTATRCSTATIASRSWPDAG